MAPSLNDLCLLIVDCEHKTAPLADHGYPSIRTPNVGRGRLILDKVNRVDRETYERWTKRAVPQANDLIIAREAPLGNVAITLPGQQVCLGQRTVLVRPDPAKVEPAYLCYFLLGEYVQSRFHGAAIGATVPHLNMKDIRNLPIPALPSLSEQRRIASILGAYDDLIEVNRRRIALLEEMARRLFEEWFVRFRFPGHEGHGVVDTPDARVPEGWEHTGLYEIAEVAFGFPFKSKLFNSKGEGVPVVRIRDIPEGFAQTWTTEPFDSRYDIRNGDLLIGMDGLFHTSVWSGGPAALNQRVTRLRPLGGRSMRWLLLSVLPKIKHLEATITGTTVAHLSARDLKAMRVLVPSMPVQRHADSLWNPIDAALLNYRLQQRSLAASRDLLLPRLVSGELSVAVAERELEAVA